MIAPVLYEAAVIRAWAKVAMLAVTAILVLLIVVDEVRHCRAMRQKDAAVDAFLEKYGDPDATP